MNANSTTRIINLHTYIGTNREALDFLGTYTLERGDSSGRLAYRTNEQMDIDRDRD